MVPICQKTKQKKPILRALSANEVKEGVLWVWSLGDKLDMKETIKENTTSQKGFYVKQSEQHKDLQ